jgi:hypothetical protein
VAQIEEPEPIAQTTEPEPTILNRPVPVQRTPPKFLNIDNAYFGVSWMPLFPVYGEGNWFYEQNFTLAGAAARLGLSSHLGSIYFGMELAGSWYAYDDGSGSLSMHFMSIGPNLLAQKWFVEERLAVVFRIGGGASIFLSRNNEDTSNTENSGMAPVYVDLGVSLLWLLNKSLYLELGVDYYHWFTDSPTGCFRPWVGMGIKF